MDNVFGNNGLWLYNLCGVFQSDTTSDEDCVSGGKKSASKEPVVFFGRNSVDVNHPQAQAIEEGGGLPAEVAALVVNFLPKKDQCEAAKVCKALNGLVVSASKRQEEADLKAFVSHLFEENLISKGAKVALSDYDLGLITSAKVNTPKEYEAFKSQLLLALVEHGVSRVGYAENKNPNEFALWSKQIKNLKHSFMLQLSNWAKIPNLVSEIVRFKTSGVMEWQTMGLHKFFKLLAGSNSVDVLVDFIEAIPAQALYDGEVFDGINLRIISELATLLGNQEAENILAPLLAKYSDSETFLAIVVGAYNSKSVQFAFEKAVELSGNEKDLENLALIIAAKIDFAASDETVLLHYNNLSTLLTKLRTLESVKGLEDPIHNNVFCHNDGSEIAAYVVKNLKNLIASKKKELS